MTGRTAGDSAEAMESSAAPRLDMDRDEWRQDDAYWGKRYSYLGNFIFLE